jgi:hypothetical protein
MRLPPGQTEAPSWQVNVAFVTGHYKVPRLPIVHWRSTAMDAGRIIVMAR